MIKRIIKKIVPTFFLNLLKKKNSYGFFGNYQTWQEAKENSVGYDSDIILNKVRESSLKVKEGKASYERDSVAFSQKEVVEPVLSYLQNVAKENDNKLHVLDYGGSLGSTYYQHKDFLKNIDLKWDIIEQKNFVETGKKYFEDSTLHFHEDSALNKLLSEKPDLVLFGSSLQYIENSYSILEKITEASIQHIMIERTPFTDKEDRIVIQIVPKRIYKASYPARIFGLQKIKDFFVLKNYQLKTETPEGEMPIDGTKTVKLKGLYFQKNAQA